MDGTRPSIRSVLDFGSVFLLVATVLAFFIPVLLLFPPVPPSKRDALLQTHSRLGVRGSKASSSSSDARKRATGGTGSTGSSGSNSSKGTIRSLWIYPVKSCKGIELDRAAVRPEGLEFDRLFTFAQLKSPFPVALDSPQEEKARHQWEFVTQRQFPLLATVQVELFVPDAAKASSLGKTGGGGAGDVLRTTESFIVFSFPWQEAGLRGTADWLGAKLAGGLRAVPEREVLLPLSFPSPQDVADRGYEYEDVKIWRETVAALNMTAELPAELRLYLGVSNKLALFRVDPAKLREVHRCAPPQSEAGYQPVTGFQDAYPLHLINLRSVRDLEDKIGKDDDMRSLDVRRFRANIVIDGTEPYDEETWKSIRFTPSAKNSDQSPRFHVSCRTVRCKMPNVNQDKGHRHPVEPDKSLRAHREVDLGAPHMGCLGMQLCPLFDRMNAPDDMREWIEVGMGIDVLETGEHRYIKQ